MLDFLKIFGASLGIVTFIWKVCELFHSYLYIHIEIGGKSGSFQIINARVENKGMKDKKIDNALLLIGPEDEKPESTYNILMKYAGDPYTATCTNMIAERRLNKVIDDNNGHIVIPLSFYYEENLKIGDEVVTYSVPVNTNKFPDGAPNSVRFFIWAAGRYHRSTHTCFIK